AFTIPAPMPCEAPVTMAVLGWLLMSDYLEFLVGICFRYGPAKVQTIELPARSGERRHRSGQKFQQGLGSRLRRGGILACDKPAIGDDEGHPVCRLFIEPTQSLQFVLHEERHDPSEVYRFLLVIGEARHPLALHDWLALELDTMQHTGCVADS